MNTEKSDSIQRKGRGEKVQEKGKPDRHLKRFSPLLATAAVLVYLLAVASGIVLAMLSNCKTRKK